MHRISGGIGVLIVTLAFDETGIPCGALEPLDCGLDRTGKLLGLPVGVAEAIDLHAVRRQTGAAGIGSTTSC